MQKIEMRVYCAECGDILTVSQPQIILNDFMLLVSPCKKCASQQSVQSDGNKVVLDGTFRCPECNFLEKHLASCSRR